MVGRVEKDEPVSSPSSGEKPFKNVSLSLAVTTNTDTSDVKKALVRSQTSFSESILECSSRP